MSDTRIAWTEKTWNPVRGCSRKSPGCTNCYAERFAARGLPGHNSPTTGEPFALMTPSGPRWTGKVALIEHMLDAPLHWRKPLRVFVNSMSDLFHESLSFDAIDRVFAVMALCRQHTFQVLTKRADRMAEYINGHQFGRVCDIAREMHAPHSDRNATYPLQNVWLGVSCEDQQRANERIPLLLRTPAAVRFVSAEPLLGPIDFSEWIAPIQMPFAKPGEYHRTEWTGGLPVKCSALPWIITGGESGPGARPCDVAWIRSIVRQCADAGTACFVKQLGANIRASGDSAYGWPINEVSGLWSDTTCDPIRIHVPDKKGGTMDEWPGDLRVRQYPEATR